jgi:hypothetical protein
LRKPVRVSRIKAAKTASPSMMGTWMMPNFRTLPFPVPGVVAALVWG